MPRCLYSVPSAKTLKTSEREELGRKQLTSQTNGLVRHHRRLRSTMPMRLPSRNMHHIADLQSPWLLTFTANQSLANGDSQDLPAFVSMPVSPGAGRETNIVAHAVFSSEDRVHVHRARESFGGLARGSRGLMGGAC